MIRIVFQNENFIVCDKPAKVLSVPAREKNDPRLCLGLELQKRLNKPVFPVHRLDYEVRGLILYALNARSHKISQDWFQNKTIRKKYRARTLLQNFSHWPENIKTDRSVLNIAVGQTWIWKTQILRGKKRSYESMNGEWAETEARIESVADGFIDWELFPITGKPHQLRLELSRRGFPILGDELYGSTYTHSEDGIALAAVEIQLNQIHDRLGLPQKIIL